DPVADGRRRDRFALEHRSREARLAMIERWHAIKQVRGMPRAGIDAFECFFVRRSSVPERNPDSLRGELSDQIDGAVDLWRDRHDPDVTWCGVDFAENFRAREAAFHRDVRRKAQALERL